MNKKEFVYDSLLYACFIILGGAITYFYLTGGFDELKINPPRNCSGMDLPDTMNCITRQTKEFYIYNLSNINVSIKDMTYERLIAEGGVCAHWTSFYLNLAEEYGFGGGKLVLDEINHVVAVFQDNRSNSYCIIDGTKSICGKIKKMGY